MMMNAARTSCSQWVTNQHLIQTGVMLDRLRLLSTLRFFDTWPEAEQQRVERVLDAYTDTLEWISREPNTLDEAAMIRVQIDSNLEVIHAFLVSDPPYLSEPEFSEMLLKTVLVSAERGGPLEQQREVGH